MNGRRLLRRDEDGIAREATSLAKDDLNCTTDANTVAHAAMIAARTPSDIDDPPAANATTEAPCVWLSGPDGARELGSTSRTVAGGRLAGQPRVERRGRGGGQMQSEFRPPPEDVLRRTRPFFAAEICDLALVELRQDFGAKIWERARVAYHSVDTRAVRTRIARAQSRRAPRITALDTAQKSLKAPGRQIASRQKRLRRPGACAIAERLRQPVHRSLG